MINTPEIGFQQRKDGEKKNEVKQNKYLLENPDFLMSANRLHLIRMANNPESRSFLETLDSEIDKIVGESDSEIFKYIIKKKKEGLKDLNIYKADIEEAAKGIPSETLLIDLPDNLLAKILKYIPRENRSMIYVQRNSLSLENALNTIDFWAKNTVIGFHVSPDKIDTAVIKPSNDGCVYYSNDIARLFNNTNDGKYLYAFIQSIKSDEQSSYAGVPDCFKKTKGSVQILDRIQIAEESDSNYKKTIMESLGAQFEENYRGAGARAEQYMKQDYTTELKY